MIPIAAEGTIYIYSLMVHRVNKISPGACVILQLHIATDGNCVHNIVSIGLHRIPAALLMTELIHPHSIPVLIPFQCKIP